MKAAVYGVMRRCMGYCLCFGCLAAFLLFTFGEPIGLHWLKNGETVRPLKLMAVTLPFVSLSSALNGYFTAVRRAAKNALVLILEQCMKIGCAVGLLACFPPKGLESACLILIGAGMAAELFSFSVSFVLYLVDRRRYAGGTGDARGMTKALCGIALPIALSAYMRSGLVTLKNLLVPIQLGKYGASSQDALSTFGLLHGVVLPVVCFPAAFLSAFANLIVPELAECRACAPDLAKSKRIHYLVGRMFQITLLFSVCVAGLFFFFADPISLAACKNPAAAQYVKLFAVIVPVMYMDTMVDSMLKGLGEQVSSMRYNVIDAAVCVLMVIVLLPVYGAKGYLVVIFVSEILNFALSAARLLKVTKFRLNLVQSVCKPVFSIVAGALFAGALLGLAGIEPASAIGGAAAPVALAVVWYLLFLVLTGCLTREDLKWIGGILRSR